MASYTTSAVDFPKFGLVCCNLPPTQLAKRFYLSLAWHAQGCIKAASKSSQQHHHAV